MSYKNEVSCADAEETLHLGAKKGEVHPLIITVGDEKRARYIAEHHLEDWKELRQRKRTFVIINGKYKGKWVSIISIGMGSSNMDFMVREVSLIVRDHPVVRIIRLGTCGIWKDGIPAGTICLHTSNYGAFRNYSYFDGTASAVSPDENPIIQSDLNEGALKKYPYLISGAVPADPELLAGLSEKLKKIEGLQVAEGTNISADCFYGSQGRHVHGWDDKSDEVHRAFRDLGVLSCEMEAHMLYHLCHHFSTKTQKMQAAALAVGVVSRTKDSVLPYDEVPKICIAAAGAVLETLIS